MLLEDADREDRRRHDVEDAFGPELAAFDAVDHPLVREQRDQLGVSADQPPARRGAQREQQRDQLDLRAQLVDDLRDFVAEQPPQPVDPVVRLAIDDGVEPGIPLRERAGHAAGRQRAANDGKIAAERAIQLDRAQRFRDGVVALALQRVENGAEIAPRRDA